MHQLDHDLHELRRQIWAIEHGLTTPTDVDHDTELARLRERFKQLGEQFTETYRAWSKQHAED
jgi:hypothetical protein